MAGKEELQIEPVYGRSEYSLRFHHDEKARFATIEEAKAAAARDLAVWREEVRLTRERDAAATARQLRERREHEARVERLVARLNAAGLAAREVFGAVTLSDEAVERVLERFARAADA